MCPKFFTANTKTLKNPFADLEDEPKFNDKEVYDLINAFNSQDAFEKIVRKLLVDLRWFRASTTQEAIPKMMRSNKSPEEIKAIFIEMNQVIRDAAKKYAEFSETSDESKVLGSAISYAMYNVASRLRVLRQEDLMYLAYKNIDENDKTGELLRKILPPAALDARLNFHISALLEAAKSNQI